MAVSSHLFNCGSPFVSEDMMTRGSPALDKDKYNFTNNRTYLINLSNQQTTRMTRTRFCFRIQPPTQTTTTVSYKLSVQYQRLRIQQGSIETGSLSI